MIETFVIKCDAKYGRTAYLKFVDSKVVFDDSEEEYGPIEFDIERLCDVLDLHAKNCLIANIDLFK